MEARKIIYEAGVRRLQSFAFFSFHLIIYLSLYVIFKPIQFTSMPKYLVYCDLKEYFVDVAWRNFEMRFS